MKKERDKCGRARRQTVVCQKGVLELILANHVLRKFDMNLVLGPEYLHILRHFGREVLDGPRAQDCMLVLYRVSFINRIFKNKIRFY